MKAVQFNSYGDPEVLEIHPDSQPPKVGKEQIRVKVSATGINPIETSIRKGYMEKMLPLSFPVTAGGDFSGIVESVGEGVGEFRHRLEDRRARLLDHGLAEVDLSVLPCRRCRGPGPSM